MTKTVAYGDESIVFVFPTPSIVTSQTYWTGSYPTVSGRQPSDLQTIALTTRKGGASALPEAGSFVLTAGASALSEAGSFESRASSFRTVTKAVARAAADPAPIEEVAEAEPTNCGESGQFTLSFDDNTVGPDDSSLLPVKGMENPYHHLFYANGYTYVPDKWEPYPAISQPNVAMFLPLAGRLLPNTAFAGTLLPGELGAGPRASVPAYWFNAYSGYFGCALSGLTPCVLQISGYRYDEEVKQEVLVASQKSRLPACWGYVDCRLTQVFLNDGFRGLSGIQFRAYTEGLGIPQVHMMDELAMSWWNNSCSAGILRMGHD